MGGTTDRIKGKLRELKGVATNDRSEEFKGKAQGAKGSVQEGLEAKARERRDRDEGQAD